MLFSEEIIIQPPKAYEYLEDAHKIRNRLDGNWWMFSLSLVHFLFYLINFVDKSRVVFNNYAKSGKLID